MKKNNEKDTLTILRERAESLLAKGGFQFKDIPPDEIRQVLHDLHTHQIELTLQNEELRETHFKLDESRAQYMDLYDHSPVGYFSFNGKGDVLAVNHTGCRMLMQEKDALPIGTLKDMERQLILKALSETGWRIEGKEGAAKVLGLHPSTLRARMHKFGIVRPKKNSRV